MVNPKGRFRPCSQTGAASKNRFCNLWSSSLSAHWLKKSARKTMENIFPNVGVFFAASAVTVNRPRLPRNPPQIHHKNTTAVHHIFQNHPQKTPAKSVLLPTPPRPHFFPETKQNSSKDSAFPTHGNPSARPSAHRPADCFHSDPSASGKSPSPAQNPWYC